MDASVFYPPDDRDADKNGVPRELEVSIKLTLLESAIAERDGEKALQVTYEVGLDMPIGKRPRFRLWLFDESGTGETIAERVFREAPTLLMKDIGASFAETLPRRFLRSMDSVEPAKKLAMPSDNAGTEAAGAAKTEPHTSDP